MFSKMGNVCTTRLHTKNWKLKINLSKELISVRKKCDYILNRIKYPTQRRENPPLLAGYEKQTMRKNKKSGK